MTERLFENIKYGSYPRNADCDDSPFEYEQRLFTKRPIYCLTNSIIERLKFILIVRSFDNRIYEINPQNTNIHDSPFDGYEKFITRLPLYHIHDDIVLSLNNSLIITVYTIQMQEE